MEPKDQQMDAAAGAQGADAGSRGNQPKVALIGNPNSGKTTLFNALTGANQRVGNWPGVTVEKKEGKLRGDTDVIITDLPGIYSLSPYTLEEVVARNYLLNEKPDAIVNIIDGSNLERNLYLTTQTVELGIPTLVVVNMMDVVEKNGDVIDLNRLSQAVGCPVMSMSALKGTGVDEVLARVSQFSREGHDPICTHEFAADVEKALTEIEGAIAGKIDERTKRFAAVKLFERDEKMVERFQMGDQFEPLIKQLETAHDDDAESIIVNERYGYIDSIIDTCLTRSKKSTDSTSDRIDRIVTNRILALPIFVVVMFLVYFLSVTTVGTWATDWANDGVFGDGWYLGAGQEELDEASGAFDEAAASIEAFDAAAEEAGLDPASDTFLVDAEAAGLTAEAASYDDDSGEETTWTVTPADYEAATEVEEPDPASYGLWVPGIPVLAEDAMVAGEVDEQVQSLVLDGIIGGVGSVLGFIPQMLVLFLLLAWLEACGYMSRIAFILDRVFRRFGLSGKSFIPMLIGTGCGVPGIMASRTIENESDRRMTVMTTTFMPCSAKLPVIALIAGALFGGVWWVAPSAYFLGIAAILCTGIILKKTRPFAGAAAPFVMELPAYHLPTVRAVLGSMWERAFSFIKKAGTIIFVAAVLIWFISSYGIVDGSFGVVEDANDSILAFLGGAIAWIFIPLGWGDWQAASAAVTGLIAKENVVATMGILYSGDAGWYNNVQMAFTPLAAYSFLAFNLLCAPCFAAIGAIRREMNSAKWFWAAIGYECGLAYCVALVIFQIGGLLNGEVMFNVFSVVALVLIALFLFMLFRPANKTLPQQGTSAVQAAGRS